MKFLGKMRGKKLKLKGFIKILSLNQDGKDSAFDAAHPTDGPRFGLFYGKKVPVTVS